MNKNEISLHLTKGVVTQTGKLFQYDYGQRLFFHGAELPNTYEVHFSNQENGQSKTMIGDATGVDIPDEYLLTGENIHVWVYLHTGESDGETEYHGIIGVTKRAQPTDQEPTPVQQSVIDQTIAALNAGVTEVEGIAEGIPQMIDTALQEAKDSGEFDGFSPVIETTEITGGHQVSITDATHTETIDVMDGEKGDPGDDGFSPSASVTKSGDTATITITDKNGTTTAQITDGQDGETGATPVISIGTVSKLSPGSNPTATMDTTDPEHPVLSLGLVTGDPGEVTEAELEEATTELKSAIDEKATLIRDTVTNVPIASVPDGADGLPLTTLRIGIDPIQDLHGQTNPYPAGGGKNLFNPSSSANEWVDTNRTLSTRADAKSVRIACSEGDTFTLSQKNESSTSNVMLISYLDSSDNVLTRNVKANGDKVLTVTAPADAAVCLASFILWSATDEQQLEKASSASTYAPYSNICPISSRTSVTLNVSDEDTSNPTQHTAQLGRTVYGGQLRWTDGKCDDEYTLVDMGDLSWAKTTATPPSFFTDSITDRERGICFICTCYKTASSTGQAAVQDMEIGGNLNSNTIYVKDSNYSDAITFKQSVTGQKILYKKATPTEITLENLDVIQPSATGQFNLWADSGDVLLMEYSCDTKLYIDKKLAEMQALILENT